MADGALPETSPARRLSWPGVESTQVIARLSGGASAALASPPLSPALVKSN